MKCYVGPFPTRADALAACDSTSDDDSIAPSCPDGYPTTLYLGYSCENCECLTTATYPSTGPTPVAPDVYAYGTTPNPCGADSGDAVTLDCRPEGGPVWTFTHASGYDTRTGTVSSFAPLVVQFGTYTQQGCSTGGPCTVTLTE